MTPSPVAVELAQKLKLKKWTIRDAAIFFGVSRQRLYSVFADPNRIRLWECAVEGMPVCNASLKQRVKEERLAMANRKPKTQVKPQDDLIAIGNGVTAVSYAGIAEEGEEGWITGIRGKGKGLAVQVKMVDGADWFPIADFNNFFMTNGKTRAEI